MNTNRTHIKPNHKHLEVYFPDFYTANSTSPETENINKVGKGRVSEAHLSITAIDIGRVDIVQGLKIPV